MRLLDASRLDRRLAVSLRSDRTRAAISSLLLGLTTLTLGACGDAGDAPDGPQTPGANGGSAGAFRRIAWTSDAAAPRSPTLLAELRPTLEMSPWTTSEADVELREMDGADTSSGKVLATAIASHGEPILVRCEVPDDARSFDTIVVEAASIGPRAEELLLVLYINGKELPAKKILDMPRRDGLNAYTFRLPGLRSTNNGPDAIGIGFQGRNPVSAIASISLIDAPAASFAPALAGEGEVIRIGESRERALGLLPGSTLSGEFEIGSDEELRLAVAPHAVLLRPQEVMRFEVEVRGAGGALERTIECEDAESWREVRISSADIGYGRGTVSVQMTSTSSDEAVGVVAIPTIRRLVRAPEDAPRRTVILITSDTHRADHLGILGPDAPVSTPNLDALARRGVLFTDCVALTNITVPSHISLMTGKHPRDVGVLTNVDRLAESASTLAEAFRDAGFETIAATSVPQLVESGGLAQGFDRMNGPTNGQRPGTVAIEQLAAWLDDSGAADVFAWLHLYDAHTPYSPPAPYDRKYYAGKDPTAGDPLPLEQRLVPSWAKDIRDIDFPYAQYRAEIDFVDGSLSKILDHPRASEAAIAFTADHGEMFGEHGIWWSHSGLYPGVTRIPLILYWPGAPAGARSKLPVTIADVGATLLDLAKVEGDVAGQSLSGQLASPPPARPRFALGAHHHSASIESDGWLLTLQMNRHAGVSVERIREVGEVELYRLTSDPDAKNDLVLDELERARRMRTALIAWLDAAPTERLAEGQERTEADVAMLAALGYGGGGQADAAVRYWDPEAREGKRWSNSPWRRLFEDDTYSIESFKKATRAGDGAERNR